MTVGRPTLDRDYAELVVDGYQIYFDKQLEAHVDNEVHIELVEGVYYKKLRLSGIELCG